MIENLAVCCFQYDIAWEDINSNLGKIQKMIDEAPAAHLYLLPEMFTTGFSKNVEALAETMTGSSVQWLQKKAQERDALFMGSLIIKENDQFFNRLVVAFPEGHIEFYDKNYLYSPAKENEVYTAGTKKLVIEYKGWRICPLICYDLRFPELSRNTEQIDLYCYSANWPVARIHHWKQLLAARAIENQSYVVGLNRIGTDGNQLEYNGQSGFYDYNGKLTLDIKSGEGIAAKKLSLNELHSYRSKYPFLDDQKAL